MALFSALTRRFSTPIQLFFTLYKAQICPSLKYGSHLWREDSEHSLDPLYVIHRQAIRLKDPALTEAQTPTTPPFRLINFTFS